MITTSGRLWRRLQYPPRRHPQFLRMTQTPITLLPSTQRGINRRASIVGCLGLIALGVIAPTLFFGLLFVLLTVAFFPILILILIFPLITIATNLGLTMRISTAITQERERGTFDLLAITPDGAWGASWTTCAGELYKHDAFTKRRKSFSNFFIPLLAFALLGAIVEPQAIPITLTVVGVTYLDHRQSVIIACLLGMWIPAHARNVIDARIWAFGSFLLLEIATYAIVLTIALAVLPGLLKSMIAIKLLRDIAIGLLSMVIFYFLLEFVIMRLWQSLNNHLAMDDAQRRLQIQITDWL